MFWGSIKITQRLISIKIPHFFFVCSSFILINFKPPSLSSLLSLLLSFFLYFFFLFFPILFIFYILLLPIFFTSSFFHNVQSSLYNNILILYYYDITMYIIDKSMVNIVFSTSSPPPFVRVLPFWFLFRYYTSAQLRPNSVLDKDYQTGKSNYFLFKNLE